MIEAPETERCGQTYARLNDQLEALREYFEVRLDAADTAIVAARSTTENALLIAEQEREKAAANLRTALEREIESGDARLSDHILHQVEQVRQGLQALTALLAERDGRMDDRFTAHKEAIGKAEGALNKRLEAMNAFREELREQASNLATRESVEAMVKQLSALLERNREDIIATKAELIGREHYESEMKQWGEWRTGIDRFQYRILGAFGLAMIIMPIIVGVLVYFLTRTAIPIDGLQQ